MVTRTVAAVIAAVTGVSATGLFMASLPARADGILEGMQKELSGIARKTRRAVVTIEAVGKDATGLASTEQFKVEVDFNVARDSLKMAQETLRESLRELDREQEAARKGQGGQANADRLKTTREAYETARKALEETQKNLQNRKPVAPAQPYVIPQYRVFRAVTSGSGFSIGDGYILTTADALSGGETVTVVTDDGKRLKAHITGVNRDRNVGLVKLDESADLLALKLGDSDRVEEGHFALTLGGRSARSRALTLGTVGRVVEKGTNAGGRFYPNLIQLSDDTNSVSGTPMLNASGDVVGIMVAGANPDRYNLNLFGTAAPKVPGLGELPVIRRLFEPPPAAPVPPTPGRQIKVEGNNVRVSPGGALDFPQGAAVTTPGAKLDIYSSMSIPDGSNPKVWVQGQPGALATTFFRAPLTGADAAIPINDVKPLIEDLKAGRTVSGGWLGIAPEASIRTITENGVTTVEQSVRIAGVYADSPAAKAGLKAGDILVELDGKPVDSDDDVRGFSSRLKPGDKVNVVVRRKRGNETETVRATLNIAPRPETPRLIDGKTDDR